MNKDWRMEEIDLSVSTVFLAMLVFISVVIMSVLFVKPLSFMNEGGKLEDLDLFGSTVFLALLVFINVVIMCVLFVKPLSFMNELLEVGGR